MKISVSLSVLALLTNTHRWRLLARILEFIGGVTMVGLLVSVTGVTLYFTGHRPHGVQPQFGFTEPIRWTRPISYGTARDAALVDSLIWWAFPALGIFALGRAIRIYKVEENFGFRSMNRLHNKMISSERREPGLDCPNCSARLPWATIGFLSPFPCTACNFELCVPGSYSRRMSVVSLGITAAIAYSLGVPGAWLPIAVLVGFFPVAMVVGSIGKRLVPPTLIFSND